MERRGPFFSFLFFLPSLPFFSSNDTNIFIYQYLNNGVTYIDRKTQPGHLMLVMVWYVIIFKVNGKETW